MFGFLRGKADELTALASKWKDKETAEAIVSVMTGCAYADGELEKAEKDKLIAAFRVHPILKQYTTSELLAKFNELSALYEFDTGEGEAAALKELQDVASRAAPEEKRLAILRMGVASAKADGEIEDAERAFLAKAAAVLGVQVSAVGL